MLKEKDRALITKALELGLRPNGVTDVCCSARLFLRTGQAPSEPEHWRTWRVWLGRALEDAGMLEPAEVPPEERNNDLCYSVYYSDHASRMSDFNWIPEDPEWYYPTELLMWGVKKYNAIHQMRESGCL